LPAKGNLASENSSFIKNFSSRGYSALRLFDGIIYRRRPLILQFNNPNHARGSSASSSTPFDCACSVGY
jgi:hypothetical protein